MDRESAEYNLSLSTDQLKAFNAVLAQLEESNEAVLVGAAGTGKTTLLTELADHYQSMGMQVMMLALTGKAGLRMQQVTGRMVKTLHAAMYGQPEVDAETGELVWNTPRLICQNDTVVIIDEVSMMGKKLYTDLKNNMPHAAKLILVGDKEQLPPVKDEWGVNFDNPTTSLTEVHRQAAGSPIIQFATAIRQRVVGEFYRDYDWVDEHLQVGNSFAAACDWAVERNLAGDDYAVICFTNAVRRMFNVTLRKGLKLDTNGSPLTVGDRMVVMQNNHGLGLMNGELLTVTSIEKMDAMDPEYTSVGVMVEFDEYPMPVKVNLNFINRKEKKSSVTDKFYKWRKSMRIGRLNRWLLLDYGQAITVHSSQGSQWEHIAFLWDDAFNKHRDWKPGEARRMLYTAATRAQTHLKLFQIENLEMME